MPAPVDSDVDLHSPAQRRELSGNPWPVLASISAGGIVGSLSRYGLQVAFPSAPTAFNWAIFGVNVAGCLLIGVLMVLVTEVWARFRLVRPFLGVGVLGGFTTFSTYVVDIQRGVLLGTAGIALAYLAATVVAALAAVWAGFAITGWAVRSRRRRIGVGS